MHVGNMNSFNLFTLVRLICCDFFIGGVDKVIIDETYRLGRKDIIDNFVKIDLLYVHIVAQAKLLIAPCLLAKYRSLESIG